MLAFATTMHRRVLAAVNLFLLYLPSAAIADLDSDKQALLMFASLLPHGRKLNWTATTPVCSWVGVVCTADRSRVLTLRLPAVGLIGPIPSDTLAKLDALEVLSLRSNRLFVDLPPDVSSIPSLHFMFLQHNNLSGYIPTSLSSSLRFLDLSYNTFIGEIPPTVRNLTHLTTLYLQNNSLSGPIPDLQLTKLKRLNLSYNNLSGPIPPSLSKFSRNSFLGNDYLCGFPLSPCTGTAPAPSPATESSPAKHKSFWKRLGIIIVIAVGGALLLTLLAVLLLVCIIPRKRSDHSSDSKGKAVSAGRADKQKQEHNSGIQEAERNKLAFFEGCIFNFDLEDLLRASAEVIGKGSYGTTYKALLEDGTTVVVKRLKEVVVPKRDFEQQIEIVGRVGLHRNVLPLRAYYYSKDEKLLIYDYMPCGGLNSVLHGSKAAGRSPPDWAMRLRIALGAARGIAHLHTECGGRFIHGNLKATNILLTRNLNARVSEFGLSHLMAATQAQVKFVGYRAPEVIETRKCTQMSDVYSFGVILLEMLTGKAPLRSPGRDDAISIEHLPRWVQSVVREEWTAEVFDADLLRQPDIEDEMVQVLQLAMACVSTAPDQRPKMAEVVRRIEEIQISDAENRPSSDDQIRSDNGQTP